MKADILRIRNIQYNFSVNILRLVTMLNIDTKYMGNILDNENFDISFRINHKINKIYNYSIYWKSKNVGTIGKYLYYGLMNLFKNNVLNDDEIIEHLNNFAYVKFRDPTMNLNYDCEY